MSSPKQVSPRADTRQRLLRTALVEFGRHDFDAVGIRQIADAAGVNIAAVSYHFGGKQDLYLETAAYLADLMHQELRPRLEPFEAALPGATPAECRKMLSDLVGGFVEILLTAEFGEDGPGFVLREQNQPTAAFDILYEKIFRPMHLLTARLVAGARGTRANSPETLMVAHALLGSAIAFRSARTTMLKHLSKPSYSRVDRTRIKRLVAGLTASAVDYDVHD